MERESFEDEEVAKLMNDTFVSIKVDREERPDIDNIYMSVCQMMTGSGGWPLTIIMTPDKKPFYAATYIPKKSRFGRPGMMEIIPKIKDIWTKNHEEVISSAEKIAYALQNKEDSDYSDNINYETLDQAYKQFYRTFDKVYGGFGGAPKFPSPHNLMFLLRYWKRTGEGKALDMVTKTLDSMALGGIFDQIGYGFHRYSTDSKWLVPHFEKMLYDQAMLAMAYTEAYQATGKTRYRKVAEKIFEYVTRDMTSDEGGFYSAEDADSEGEEGQFYVWSIDEVRRVLNDEETRLAEKVFNMTEDGNFNEEATGKKTGYNILHYKKSLADIGKETDIPDIEDKIESIRQKLFKNREQRVRPYRDDKILTDWNGLMIAALCKAAAVFNNEKYSEIAKNAIDFIIRGMNENGRLMHRYRLGEWKIPGNIDDYAFFIWGLIEYYEAAFNADYLEKAFELNEEMIKLFWDDKKGGFFFTASDTEELLIRNKEIYDGAVPSGNSAAVLNLLRLGRIAAKPQYEEMSGRIINAFSNEIASVPYAYAMLLCGLEFSLGTSFEVVIVGNPDSIDTKEMIKSIRRKYIPNKVVILNPEGKEANKIYSIAKYTKEQGRVNGMATAYVCRDYACRKPTNNTDEILQYLDETE